jgi:hypothetical protein
MSTKKLLPTEKRARGTYAPFRDADRVEFIEAPSVPAEPASLTEGGRQVWLDIIPHVAGRLAGERDSLLLGQLANLTAACNAAWASGAAPPAAHLAEVRRLCEIFGLAGRRSRMGVLPAGRAEPNPFTRNGRPRTERRVVGQFENCVMNDRKTEL